MNITKDTSDEELFAPVAAAKKRLAEALTDDKHHAEDFATMANSIAHAEGRVQVRHEVRQALRMDATPVQINAELINILMRGADDTYSGRGNDNRRAHFDGVREEIRGVTYQLRLADWEGRA